ncbi:MAG: flagellar basal body L-ring protein FlgH [Gammaproteobacteria bacterium]|nr:flagellar basal body L-ring protein FlgH [Gammaproteobacteria bacterium]
MKKNILILLLFVFTMSLAHATSMYNEEEYQALVSDPIAMKVGDSITVLIYETASASASTSADTSKETGIAVGGINTFVDPDNQSFDIESTFNGGGDLSRSGKLLAKITTTVMEIAENGEMLIQGQQNIEINEDTQTITLSGRIRKEDISSDNTIVSTRLSDAKIKYIAEGTLADRQKPGLITSFLNWIY